ncbi:MAG: GntR family transcriptional regulator, partial [Pseudomonadota bacterium]
MDIPVSPSGPIMARPTRGGTRAADHLVSALEARIVSGALPDGGTLPAERDLMEQYDVSRTVVREAITALASRGLIEARPRHRPLVRKPRFETVLDATGTIVRHLLTTGDGVANLYQSR